ncbi:chromosome partitioning protein ParB [Pseudooceanicola nanhaiensis]|jgi:ParB family chromosome partitioning protein|uniref:Chromosome partitioning protein ParB n=1 Tax=Pseudooceanicola nanhaiensis TaxID=375761 RepID=A0A917T7V5_9RHOB|nr:ParB/RepB/Spo0J family partition protein [Pseudooceanicola nanhaiensis]GGM13027.1 chromosome partitioning protein ParB [Pseudooceanicola nanhaiensis]
MAKSAQKVTLSPSRDIPFDKLVLSQANVRRIKAGISVEELAEDIARRGLLQSLSVRPVLADDGSETGKFEIPAGGRRFQALSLLVKQKRLAKTTPIPCIVRDAKSTILAEDDSLAENMQRAALHPLDQFRAFVALREKGQGDEEIAAAFFVTPQVVKQRLKLAAVAPALLELYAEDEMTLEQLMAFTVNPDHERQVQVWEAIRSSWNKEPYQIRRMLTETSVRASDRRAVFVGVAAYEVAGGTMLHDLFQGDDGGWLEDPALLDRLVSEKLQAEAEAIATEGWKWIEVSLDLPYGYSHGLRRLSGDPAPMTDDEGAAHAKLLAEYRALEEEYEDQDEFPEEIDARLGELEVAMEKLEARPLIFDDEEIARAGAFVTLDRYGELAVYRGFVRPEDEPREDADVHSGEQAADGQGVELSAGCNVDGVGHGTVITSAGQALAAIVPEDEDDGALKPLPERLVMELTAHRTLALREAVGRSPDVALTLLLLKLVNDTFRTSSSAGSCLEASVRHVYMSAQASDLKDSVVAELVDDRHAEWEADLPLGNDSALWDYLTSLDQGSRLSLLAHCLSFGINALHEKVNPYGAGISASGLTKRMTQSDLVAQAVELDMVEAGWEPTADTYLNRVPKARILEAVREAKGDGTAQLLDHLKKGEMATEAERLLKGSGWLPEVLRRHDLVALNGAEGQGASEPVSDAEQAEDVDLPAFLTADLADDDASMMAAE